MLCNEVVYTRWFGIRLHVSWAQSYMLPIYFRVRSLAFVFLRFSLCEGRGATIRAPTIISITLGPRRAGGRGLVGVAFGTSRDPELSTTPLL